MSWRWRQCIRGVLALEGLHRRRGVGGEAGAGRLMGRQQCQLKRVGGCALGGHRLAGWWGVDINRWMRHIGRAVLSGWRLCVRRAP
jgi:hypothetical protein